MAYTLSARGALAVVDGAPVVESVVTNLPRFCKAAVVGVTVTVTGAPATLNYRAAVEASLDGANWEQIIRFADFTAAGVQVARANGNSSISDATEALSDLTSAAAAAVLIDTPWPRYMRVVTMLQALTGGTAPTVKGVIVLDVG